MVSPFIASATSGRATVKPMGAPLPRLLALVIISGVTPHFSMPNHFPPMPAPPGLHLVADEQAAEFLDDAVNDLEIFLRRRDETADALNRFGDECSDASGGGRADHFFDVARTANIAARIFQAERAAVTIRVDRVDKAVTGAAPPRRHPAFPVAAIATADRP